MLLIPPVLERVPPGASLQRLSMVIFHTLYLSIQLRNLKSDDLSSFHVKSNKYLNICTNFLPCDTSGSTLINKSTPILEHSDKLVLSLISDISGVHSEVKIAGFDPQLLSSAVLDIDPIDDKFLNNQTMAVARRVERSHRIFTFELASVPSLCICCSKLGEMPNDLADDISIETGVEVSGETEVTGILANRASLGQSVHNRSDVLSGAVNFPGTADTVAEVGSVGVRLEPSTADGGSKKIGSKH
ncbi:hypothetical protein HG531_009158 [Fusarium graminearum]|nr:hypothetical protein HG531_009158 [Fusarium graminearum]